jgi:hypothetical protein
MRPIQFYVDFGIRDTIARVFNKVWQMACFAGFLAGRALTSR